MISLSEMGEKIAHARKQAKLTQSELARRAGVSRPTIVLIENGRATELGYSRLVRILAVLGLELQLTTIASGRPTLEDLLREDFDND
jgi:transcriptional regulator with XRE-family HTH domain